MKGGNNMVMTRGITAAMYYYHPYAYFSAEKTRAKVIKWIADPFFSDKLVNKDRIKRIISREIRMKTGKTVDEQNLVFVYPMKIEYEVAPLTFFCRQCGVLTMFKGLEYLKKHLDGWKKFRCQNDVNGKKCGGQMIQMGHIFVCSCGRIDEIEPESHCGRSMKFVKPSLDDVSTWGFRCQVCRETKPLEKYCPSCGGRMSLKPCDASGVTIPLSTTIPSYAEPKEEWIMEYFGWSSGIDIESLQKAGLDDSEIEYLKRSKLRKSGLQSLTKIAKDPYEQELIRDKILDYTAVRSCRQAECNLETKYGFEKIYFVDGVQLVQCLYAFAVGSYDFEEVKNKNGFRFFLDNNKYQVITREVETEGILLEFSKLSVVEWLKNIGVIQNIPEKPLSEWFVEVAMNDNYQNIRTKIKELVHTVSHSLIKTAPIFCGIDSNGIRETLFIEIPAVLLYNNTNSTLGSMRTLFETKFEDWFNAAKEEVENCIHDPVCIKDKDGASCVGCVMVSEVSCEEFNMNLNRRAVIDNGLEKGYWAR